MATLATAGVPFFALGFASAGLYSALMEQSKPSSVRQAKGATVPVLNSIKYVWSGSGMPTLASETLPNS
ncbi:hypothetical protein Barb7_01848 [Bacteroidales bacterium Barb7]|nr:hypothetical protein Barb7_01848 [Bacteroidales bacterium Barb7]